MTFWNANKGDFNNKSPSHSSMRRSIHEIYNDHKYIARILEKKLTSESRPSKIIKIQNKIDKFYSYENEYMGLDLQDSIYFLAKLIHKYLQRKVFVIIDEFDAPLKTLNRGSKEYQNAKIILSGMLLEAFKFRANEDLFEKVILTGVFDFPLKILKPSLDNFSVCNVFTPIFPSIIGFTEDEVNDLVDEGFVQSPHLEQQKKKLKEWYGGYRVGNTNIFNSWSIMKCLEKMKSQESNSVVSYLTGTQSILKIQSRIGKLVYSKALEELFAKGSVTLYNIYSKSVLDDENYRKELDILNLLVFTGYLTQGESKHTYVIPNIEVKIDFYNRFFYNWIKAALQLGRRCDVQEIMRNLETSLTDLPEYLNILQEELLSNLTQTKVPEVNFENLLGGIEMYASLFMTDSSHTVYPELSNQSLQKLNFIFKPRPKKSKIHIIHKYKTIDSEIEVEDAIENAIWEVYGEKHISSVLRDIIFTNGALIVIRAFAFYRNEQGEWLVNAKGFIHDFNQASNIESIFSAVENGALLKQNMKLSEKENTLMNDYDRVKFLRAHGASNIYDILSKYSLQECSEPRKNNPKIKKRLKLDECSPEQESLCSMF